jgi:hypothetical protein
MTISMHRGVLALIISTSLAAVLVAQSPEPSSPFGLTMGMSQAQLFKLLGAAPDRTGSIATKRVPRPDRAFETYRLRVSPALGLCRVSGIGRNIGINAQGQQLKTAFAAMVAGLTARYGPPSSVVDRLVPGSRLNGPDEWTTALLREERTLMTYWSSPANAPDLSGISVRALALNRSTGYLLLAYEGKDYRICRDEAAQTVESGR